MNDTRRKEDLRRLSAEDILCGVFSPVEWMVLVEDPSPLRRMYACNNPECPTEMLLLATWDKSPAYIGVRTTAVEHQNAPQSLIDEAYASKEGSPMRLAVLSRRDFAWEAMKDSIPRFSFGEKLILFGRSDCPDWMLVFMWSVPPQMSLDGKDDINVPLRIAARRKLKRMGKDVVTIEEVASL